MCLLVTFMSPAKRAETMEMPFGAESDGPKEPCISWVQIQKGQFWELSAQSEKHGASLYIALSPHPRTDFNECIRHVTCFPASVWGHVNTAPHTGEKHHKKTISGT